MLLIHCSCIMFNYTEPRGSELVEGVLHLRHQLADEVDEAHVLEYVYICIYIYIYMHVDI